MFDRNGEQVAEVALEQAGACISIEWDKDGEVGGLALAARGALRTPRAAPPSWGPRIRGMPMHLMSCEEQSVRGLLRACALWWFRAAGRLRGGHQGAPPFPPPLIPVRASLRLVPFSLCRLLIS